MYQPNNNEIQKCYDQTQEYDCEDYTLEAIEHCKNTFRPNNGCSFPRFVRIEARRRRLAAIKYEHKRFDKHKYDIAKSAAREMNLDWSLDIADILDGEENGLLDGMMNQYTQEELAKDMKCTQSTVSRKVNNLKNKLENYIENKTT